MYELLIFLTVNYVDIFSCIGKFFKDKDLIGSYVKFVCVALAIAVNGSGAQRQVVC